MKQLKFIQVPDGHYAVTRDGKIYDLELKSFYIMQSLVTIEEYLEWYEELGSCNHVGGTYRYFNHVNPTNSIYLDRARNQYVIKDGFQNTPMRGVNWTGAFHFAQSYGGRLPSELEWEICARSGHMDYLYPWGNTSPDFSKANYGNHIGYPQESNLYYENEWGLRDMAVNLREWCMDRYYPSFPFAYHTHRNRASSLYRTIKGGAWDKTEDFLRCSFSEGKWERIGTMSLGFRVIICDDMSWRSELISLLQNCSENERLRNG